MGRCGRAALLRRDVTGVVGPVAGHGVDLLFLGDLVKQVWQDRAVTVAAGVNATARMPEVAVSMARCTLRHELCCATGPSDLANATALNAVLLGLPFAIAREPDPGAVYKQVQWPIRAPIGDLDSASLLPTAKGGVVWHRPVQPRHP